MADDPVPDAVVRNPVVPNPVVPNPVVPDDPLRAGPGAPAIPLADLSVRVAAWRSDPRVVAAVAAIVVVAAAAAWLRSNTAAAPPGSGTSTDATAAAAGETTTTVGGRVLVHVVGAVRAPGVVELAAGARVVDAVTAAGGADDAADLSRLNLAQRVTDGERVAVPRLGEPVPAGPATGSGGDGSGGGAEGGLINVNTATAAQLEELPGVGPAIAAAIVRERERSGGFRKVDDLQRVRGIGPARLEQLRDLVAV